MRETQEQTILVVSDDIALCAATRREFECEGSLRVAAVSTIDAARRVIVDVAPVVILLDETAVAAEPGCTSDTSSSQLSSVVSLLTLRAPVIVIGAARREVELAALLNAGAATFVPGGSGCVAAALQHLEERLRQANNPSVPAFSGTANNEANATEAFGEILRHELNNPLTGILGNAELLLAEVRRKNDGRLPRGGQQRLETIAELAVRLRETVRRLSEDWETRHHAAS